jgi:hypothetical protein
MNKIQVHTLEVQKYPVPYLSPMHVHQSDGPGPVHRPMPNACQLPNLFAESLTEFLNIPSRHLSNLAMESWGTKLSVGGESTCLALKVPVQVAC